MHKSIAIWGIGLILLLTALVFLPRQMVLPAFSFGNLKTTPDESGSILFVGDVMFGRNVERLRKKEGNDYPIKGVESFLKKFKYVVGNFESAIPKTHQETPSFTFRFSVDESSVSVLKNAGFDAFSLANNHAYDYGSEGFEHAKEVCSSVDMLCFGAPSPLNRYDTHLFHIQGGTIGVMALETVTGNFNDTLAKTTIEVLQKESDIQIVYIHWGDEYLLRHSKEQERLAHFFIDMGADAVIGHHPHVVQDIEIYDNKPIFYSLGNFIFDQYFSPDVQEGVGISVSLGRTSIAYTIHGFTSKDTRSQPRLMDSVEKTRLLTRILPKVAGEKEVDGETGTFLLPR